jgi:hypothetical protein
VAQPIRRDGSRGASDRSSRPYHSSGATNAEVTGKIIYLRLNYHFGPAKIAMYLRRYHDIGISPSGEGRILFRLDLNRLPGSQSTRPTTRGGDVTRSSNQDTPSRSISSSSHLWVGLGNASTSSLLLMTAHGCGCYVSIPNATRRPLSSSLTISWRSCRCGLTRSRPTTAASSLPSSATTCWTEVSDTSPSNPQPRVSTAK